MVDPPRSEPVCKPYAVHPSMSLTAQERRKVSYMECNKKELRDELIVGLSGFVLSVCREGSTASDERVGAMAKVAELVLKKL